MKDVRTKAQIPDSDTPIPSTTDDVCDEVRTMTINRIRKTNFGGAHPDNIHVTVHRSVTLEGVEINEVVPGYEDLVITGGTRDRKWQHIIDNLPVYILDGEGEPAYYQYSVTETEVPGCDTEIQGSDGTYTITNTQHPIIPTGVARTMYLGILILGALAIIIRVKQRRSIKED